MKKIFIIFLLILFLPEGIFAETYTVSTATTTVDGDTFCDGTCDGADEIVLTAGARGNLLIRDMTGTAENYITVRNEDSVTNTPVTITNDGTVGAGVLSILNCRYMDLNGAGDPDITYGIVVVEDGTPTVRSNIVWGYGNTTAGGAGDFDYVKIRYLDISSTVPIETYQSTGIMIKDAFTPLTTTFTGVEIANNYIHNTAYCAMYLGCNDPYGLYNPPTKYTHWIGGFQIHDNLMVDVGGYGITYKGVNGSNNRIYNNIIRASDRINDVRSTGLSIPETGVACGGIGTQCVVDPYYVEIDNNWIEKTAHQGIYVSLARHKVHDNIILGCGVGAVGDVYYSSYNHYAITVILTYLDYPNYRYGTPPYSGFEIYDNIIIQPDSGWLYTAASTSVTADRNWIGDSGSYVAGGTLTLGTGDDANITYTDPSDFGFQSWSDDNDYSNDDFSISAGVEGSVFTQTSGNITEAGIVTGGATIILNLDGTTWSAFDNTIRAAIVAGMDSEKSEATGWDALIKADPGSWSATGVVRTSDTVCTITLPASATYDITENETITITVPASAVTSAEAIQAGPDVLISADIPVASGTGYIGSYHANGCVATSLAQNFITDGTFDKTTVGSDLFDAETLGPELVTNGDFSAWTGDNPNGWTVSGESGSDPMITEVSGACRIYTTGTLVYLKTEGILEIGKTYKITFDIVSSVSSYLKIGNDSSVINITSNVSSVGSKTYYHRVVNEWAEEYIVIARGIGLTDITIDNFSVKEVTANARGQFSAPTAGSSDEIDDVTDRDFSDGNVGNWVAYEDGASTLTYDTTDLDFVDDKQIWLDVEDDGDETTYAYASIPSTAASVAASGLYEFRCKARSTVTTTVGGSDADMDTIWSGTQSLTANTLTRVTLYFYVGADAVGNILFGFSGDPSDEDGLRMDDFSIKKVNLSWVPYSTNKISVVDDSGNWALKTEYVDNSSGAYLSLRNIKDLTSDLTPGSQYKVILNTKVDTGDTVKGRIFDTSGDSYSGYFTTNYADYNIYYNCGSIESGSSLFSDMGTGDVVYINTITVQPVTLTHWVAGAGWGAYATAGAQVAKAYCYNATGQLQHTWTPTPGYTYMVRYTIADYSGTDAIVASLGGVNLTPRSANGTYEENVTALDATPLAFTGDIDVICTIDDVGAWRIGGS